MSFAPPAAYRQDQPLWKRSGILVAVVIVHLLMLIALLSLAPQMVFVPMSNPTVVTLLPDAEEQRETARQTRAASASAARPTRDTPDRPPDPVPPPPVELPPSAADAIWRQVMPMSRSELSAADVSRMPGRAGPAQTADARGDGPAGENGDDGLRGPNGETLYAAEWQRKPTDAELSGYLPKTRPPRGWGMIACQTVSGNRVEDCIELGQSPPGSGLARAIRQAAWQFRVLPPRIGGRPQVGAWVRIRIDYGIRDGD